MFIILQSLQIVEVMSTLFQCKICEEGVALHSQVRPESMKGLHQRMEELLEDYR